MTAQLPKNLWLEMIHHAVWLKNRTSTQALNGKTPYEVIYGVKPNLANLPDWGAQVFMMKESSGKLDSKAIEGCWLGYSSVSKGHCIYRPNCQIMVKCNVTFKNTVLQVPGPIPIAGEDKSNSIIKPSNQNTMVQNVSSQQKPGGPSGQNASAEKPFVDQIVSDLEEALSCQPLR